jgi:glycine cleavage system transcriptional repressor
MSKYLVLNAMGSDRTGSVSELIKLATKCGCNIIDSRMAIFGREFTLIMLLQGDSKAINQLEQKLPAIAHRLELITMMKRTSDYQPLSCSEYYQAQFAGIDQPGILKSITAFFAARNIDLSSLKSVINPKNNMVNATISFSMNGQSSIDEIERDFLGLCQQIDAQGCIKSVSENSL